MPWEMKDVDDHVKGLSDSAKSTWLKVANASLKRCIDGGGDDKSCAPSAIKIANTVAKGIDKGTKHVIANDNIMIITFEDGEVRMFDMDKIGYDDIHEYKKDMVSIPDVEIFATGEWNGDKYTKDDLDEMVRAFEEFKPRWKPPIKLGHHGQPKDKKVRIEQPALGFVSKLKRAGDKLLATFENIPGTLADAIKKGLYGRRSAEVFWDFKDGGQVWPRVLSAVAILGSSIPAVTTLADIKKFFEEHDTAFVFPEDAEARLYEFGGEEVRNYMVWNENLKTIEADVQPAGAFVPASLSEKEVDVFDGVTVVVGKLTGAKEHDAEKEFVQKWIFDRTKWTVDGAKTLLDSFCCLPQPEVARYSMDEAVNKLYQTMKTDGGQKFPKEAYLHVPDEEIPSTWKLRIWESSSDKVTKVQLGRAAAALSPAGFRGQKVDLPAGELQKMKKKLVSLYRGIDVSDDEIPKYLFESIIINKNGGKKMEHDEIIAQKDTRISELEAEITALKSKQTEEGMKELEQKLAAVTAELDTLKEVQKQFTELQKEHDNVKAENAELKKGQRKMEIDTFVDSLKREGKVLPRDEDMLKQILIEAPDEKTFSVEGAEDKVSISDMVKKFFSTQDKKVTFGEAMKKGSDREPTYASAAKEVHEKATAYAVEHKVKFVEAVSAVLKQDEGLAKRYAYGDTSGE